VDLDELIPEHLAVVVGNVFEDCRDAGACEYFACRCNLLRAWFPFLIAACSDGACQYAEGGIDEQEQAPACGSDDLGSRASVDAADFRAGDRLGFALQAVRAFGGAQHKSRSWVTAAHGLRLLISVWALILTCVVISVGCEIYLTFSC